jgi:hypothetical protein
MQNLALFLPLVPMRAIADRWCSRLVWYVPGRSHDLAGSYYRNYSLTLAQQVSYKITS